MKAAYEYYQNSIRELRKERENHQSSNSSAQQRVVLTRAEQSLVNLFNSGQGHRLVASYASATAN